MSLAPLPLLLAALALGVCGTKAPPDRQPAPAQAADRPISAAPGSAEATLELACSAVADQAAIARAYSSISTTRAALRDRARLVTRNAQTLTLIRRALRQSMASSGPAKSLEIGRAERYRLLARLVALEGRAYEDRKNLPQAACSYVDAIELGQHLERGFGGIVQMLVGGACQSIGRAGIPRVLPRLGEKAARAAAERILRLETARPSFGWTLRMETLCGLPVPPKERGTLGAAITVAAYRLLLQGMEEAVAAPFARRPAHLFGETEKEGAVPSFQSLRNIEGPVVEAAWFYHANSRAQNGMAAVSLALRAYQLAHGAYPPSLNALVPAYLPSAPDDPFAAQPQPLRYRRQGNGYLLYSVGPDAKDDCGRPVRKPKPGGGSSTIWFRTATGDLLPGQRL